MFYRPAPVRLPRSFISNLRTRSFQSDSNAPKFRPYVFIPIHTPLLNVASTGRLYLITQLFFIPVTTNASSAPDIQELSCCHTPFARIFSWASTHRANSRLPGSAKPAANFTKPAPKWLPKLAQEFHTNDWSRWYSVAEVANVYRRSQIVVNIGRDDFPQDANLRVFEVLASGTLLLTSMPTELAQLGFQQGAHFVGYCDPARGSCPGGTYL